MDVWHCHGSANPNPVRGQTYAVGISRPKTPVPPDILAAITAHLSEWHDGTRLDLAEVGKRSRSIAHRVVWHDGPGWRDAWFECRRCSHGFNRFLVDVDRDQPTHRMLRLIQAHFAQHDHPGFHGLQDLGTRAHPHLGQLALYVPPHPQDGASLVCRTCKRVGRNPVMLTPPPYGDARRLLLVKRRYPDLAITMLGWSSQDQADTLNALDQDLIGQPNPQAARAALTHAHTPTKHGRRNLQHHALTHLLIQRTRHGEGIDAVITHLALLSQTNPIDFTCQLGEALITLGALRDQRMHPRDFADRVRRLLQLPTDRYPTTSRRTLYRLWGSVEGSGRGGNVATSKGVG